MDSTTAQWGKHSGSNINSSAPRWYGSNLEMLNLQTHVTDYVYEQFFQNCSQMNATEHL